MEDKDKQQFAVAGVREDGFVALGTLDKLFTSPSRKTADSVAFQETVRTSGRIRRLWFEVVAFRRGKRWNPPAVKVPPDFDRLQSDVVMDIVKHGYNWIAREWVRWPEGDVTIHDWAAFNQVGQAIEWGKALVANDFEEIPACVVLDGVKVWDTEWEVDHSDDERWS